MWLERREPDATVVVIPSDHYLADERGIADHLLALTAVAGSDPNRIFLLGARPNRPEPGYGWIEPGEVIGVAGSRSVRTVRRFVEKPSEDAARAMLERGWLWSTLILVGRAATLAALGRDHLGGVHRSLMQVVRVGDSRRSEAALRRAYAEIRHADFSRDLLERVPDRLGVSVLSDLEWSDLGTPERVQAVVRASGHTTGWAMHLELADRSS